MDDEQGRARAFSRGARGETPRKKQTDAEGGGCGALYKRKARVPAFPRRLVRELSASPWRGVRRYRGGASSL